MAATALSGFRARASTDRNTVEGSRWRGAPPCPGRSRPGRRPVRTERGGWRVTSRARAPRRRSASWPCQPPRILLVDNAAEPVLGELPRRLNCTTPLLSMKTELGGASTRRRRPGGRPGRTGLGTDLELVAVYARLVEVVANGDANDLDALGRVVAGDRYEAGLLGAAGTTPAGPEVEHHGWPLNWLRLIGFPSRSVPLKSGAGCPMVARLWLPCVMGCCSEHPVRRWPIPPHRRAGARRRRRSRLTLAGVRVEADDPEVDVIEGGQHRKEPEGGDGGGAGTRAYRRWPGRGKYTA